MELKPDMYVRTKKGNIGKITFISPLDGLMNLDTENYSIGEHFIIKSSYNIIDLIEVGDYVNGSKVEQIDFGLNDDRVQVVTTECYVGQENFEYDVITANEIKSIVTKEQFENMSYKVGD